MHSVCVDLADRKATGEAAREVAQRFDVTTVVHNAGVIKPALLPEVQLDDLDTLLRPSPRIARSSSCRRPCPAMRERHYGRVILLSSRAALGLATRTSYSATKAGMLGMARTSALELGGDGITVNVVAPSPIRTDMFYDVVQSRKREGTPARAVALPVQAAGEATDVARAWASSPTRPTGS